MVVLCEMEILLNIASVLTRIRFCSYDQKRNIGYSQSGKQRTETFLARMFNLCPLSLYKGIISLISMATRLSWD